MAEMDVTSATYEIAILVMGMLKAFDMVRVQRIMEDVQGILDAKELLVQDFQLAVHIETQQGIVSQQT